MEEEQRGIIASDTGYIYKQNITGLSAQPDCKERTTHAEEAFIFEILHIVSSLCIYSAFWLPTITPLLLLTHLSVIYGCRMDLRKKHKHRDECVAHLETGGKYVRLRVLF